MIIFTGSSRAARSSQSQTGLPPTRVVEPIIVLYAELFLKTLKRPVLPAEL